MPAASVRSRAASAALSGRVTGEPVCSTRILGPFLAQLEGRGLAVDALLAPLGLDADQVRDRDKDQFIPHSAFVGFVRAAVQLTGDPALGPHAAEAVRPGDFHVLEYAAGSCANLGESMHCAARYLRLMHAGMHVWLAVEDELATLHFEVSDAIDTSAVAMEFLVANFLMFGRRYTGMNLRPLAIDFRHRQPPNPSEHERVFGCVVNFAAARSAMCFPATALELPYAHGDRALRAILEQHADHLLSQVPDRPTFSQRVRELIASELRGGNPGVEHIARRLHISARTLHRRLSEEGTTHKRLTDELRKDLAVRYLRERDISLGEISFLLGFSHPNAFHKAFKRWTNETPSQFRARVKRR